MTDINPERTHIHMVNWFLVIGDVVKRLELTFAFNTKSQNHFPLCINTFLISVVAMPLIEFYYFTFIGLKPNATISVMAMPLLRALPNIGN